MKKREFDLKSATSNMGLGEEMRKRNAEKKELLSNDNYILWLEKFTLTYQRFADINWLYKPEELPEVDTNNVGKIEIFFEALSDYCQKYYINMDVNNTHESRHINIKYNGVGYEIGLIVGQGAFVYVGRKAPEDSAIDFNDVLNDIAPKDFDAKKDLIGKFEQIVTEMKAMNIPKSLMLAIAQK